MKCNFMVGFYQCQHVILLLVSVYGSDIFMSIYSHLYGKLRKQPVQLRIAVRWENIILRVDVKFINNYEGDL